MYLDATRSVYSDLDTTQDALLDLDASQTRRLYLAGTVAFPTPFPSTGEISIVDGSVLRSVGGKRQNELFVCIQESSLLEQTMMRVILKQDVAAIFFPGSFEDTEEGPVYRFSGRECAHDLDQGEWFLGSDVNDNTISARLGIDISSRESGAFGIVFVPEHRPVLTIHESTQTAGASEVMPIGWSGCTRC